MTDEPKHTAGPWRAVKTAHGPIDIVIPDGRDIVTVYGGGTGNKEANARLIASAPEMLDALKLAVQDVTAMAFNTRNGRSKGILNGRVKDYEAVIAKAEGRSK